MSAEHGMLKCLCIAGSLVAGMASSVAAQSIDLESDGLRFLTVEAGPVELDLDVVVSTAFDLNAVSVALTSNQPALFAYREPVYTVGAPFVEQDLQGNTLPDPDQPLNQPATFTFFSVAQTYGLERFPSTIVTIHLKSIEDLEAGTYTFSFDPTLTQWGNDFQLTTFLNRGMFTLTVTPSDPGDDNGDDGDGDDGTDDDDVVGPPVPGDDTDDDDTGDDDDGSSNGGGGPSGGNGGSGGSPSAPVLCGTGTGQMLILSMALLGVVPWRRNRGGG